VLRRGQRVNLVEVHDVVDEIVVVAQHRDLELDAGFQAVNDTSCIQLSVVDKNDSWREGREHLWGNSAQLRQFPVILVDVSRVFLELQPQPPQCSTVGSAGVRQNHARVRRQEIQR